MKPQDLMDFLTQLNEDILGNKVNDGSIQDYIEELNAVAGRIAETPAKESLALLRCLSGMLPAMFTDARLQTLVLELVQELLTGWADQAEFTKEQDGPLDVVVMKMELFASPPAAPVEPSGPAAPPAPRVARNYDYGQFEDGIFQDYIVESNELLAALETDLLNLIEADIERINRVFRAMHTFKGMSGMVDITDAHELTHSLESLVEKIRDGHIKANTEMETLFLEVVDYLRDVTRRVEQRENPLVDGEALKARAKAFLTGASAPAPAAAPAPALAAAKPAAASKPAEAEPTPLEAATKKSSGGKKPPTASFLRVETGKVDLLMEQVGEMLIERIRLEQHQRGVQDLVSTVRKTWESRYSRRKEKTKEAITEDFLREVREKLENLQARFSQSVEEISRSASELQDTVMKMRLVPLDQIFSRFPRLVRDTSLKLGKEIKFDIEGGETEIDKGVCETLPDPLIHMIRNSLDHGLEGPEERAKAGKEPVGQIKLRAYYEGDKVAIEISDDGRGIDTEKVVKKAIQNGLMTAEEAAVMSDQQKMRLIFAPGFSTAEKVSDMSGRGVGMDVVKTTVEKLNGVIDILSDRGKGSTMRIRLPITMAVLGILLFKVRGHLLSLPLYNIQETLVVPENEIYESNNIEVINLRGNTIPLVHLWEVLGIRGHSETTKAGKRSIIIVEIADSTLGIVIDQLLDKTDIIIKKFSGAVTKIPYLSGGAILGDGEVVPILDLIEIVKDAEKYHHRAAIAPRPTASAGASSEADKKAGAVTGPTRQKVLVVEDSKTMAQFLSTFLENNGFDADIAESGEEGLQLLGKRHYDVISTDIVMPGIDGYEFTQRLRGIPKFALTPVVALTQKGASLDRIKGFRAGIDEYLTKPIQEDAYISIIRNLAARSAAQTPSQ